MQVWTSLGIKTDTPVTHLQSDQATISKAKRISLHMNSMQLKVILTNRKGYGIQARALN